MYEEYMQNFLNYPGEEYPNTYDQMIENYPYSYSNQNRFGYQYQVPSYPVQNRNSMQTVELENDYPEIYKIVYPMVRKVCSKNNRGINQEEVDRMVDEVYRNIEENDGIQLNITLNQEVRGEKTAENREEKEENRQRRRNNLLNDLIRILILRELTGRPGCIGPNCNPRPRPRPPRPNPWQRPPFPRYDFEGME